MRSSEFQCIESLSVSPENRQTKGWRHTSAALAHKLPISSRSQTTITAPGVEPPEGQDSFLLSNRRVSTGYFEMLSMPLLRGRVFDERDRADAPGVIILNETMANHLWPGVAARPGVDAAGGVTARRERSSRYCSGPCPAASLCLAARITPRAAP